MTPGCRLSFPKTIAMSCVALLLLLCSAAAPYAEQCPAGVRGAWQGEFPARRLLELRLAIHEKPGGGYQGEIRSEDSSESTPVWQDGSHLRFQSSRTPVAFNGRMSADGRRIGGFVQFASTITRVELMLDPGSEPRTWEAAWNSLDVHEETVRLDLYVGDDGAGGTDGFWFFRDQRLPALWGYGLECHGNAVRLGEKTLGLEFEGRFNHVPDMMAMTVKGPGGAFPIVFRRIPQERVPSFPDAPEAPARSPGSSTYAGRMPEAVNDGWLTSKPCAVGIDTDKISEMILAVAGEEMKLTHAVLIARHGKLAVEEYFYGFNRDSWHDMRSASKTITSTLVGIAVQENRIENIQSTALSFFPNYRRYANWDPRKAQITVRDLLTMSSGLDANDSDPKSPASEGVYQSQMERPDWIKLALDAPMIDDPGRQPLYGGANPLILGGILDRSVGEPVEWFAHRTLFGPLGIEHYKFILDPMGIVYMGGGLHMRPRDMLKIGQLYLDGGVWQGRRILQEKWVRESWGRYGRLAPLDRNGHQYGYLWWHHKYDLGDRIIETVEARGNGGQYIFIVPSLDMVVVITAGNFRTGRTRQPEELLRRFILPAIPQSSEGQ